MKISLFLAKNIIIIIGIGISTVTIAQTNPSEVLLGEYTFDNGSKSASNVVPNITFDDINYFASDTKNFTSNYEVVDDHSCITLSSFTNTLTPKRGVAITITPAEGKIFVITRMELNHKGNTGCYVLDKRFYKYN